MVTAQDGWRDPSRHENTFVRANGVRLNCLDWSGSGPPLIFVHGYGDTPHVFDNLAPSFGDDFRVIAYARRGCGRSEAKAPYDTPTLAQDLLGLMDSLKIRTATLVGLSMGGNEITWLAGRHPDRVERLVYLDAAYDWADFADGWQTLAPDLFATKGWMGSLEAYRARQQAVCFPEVKDMGILEAYLRDKVIVEPDGTLRNRESPEAQLELEMTLLRDRRDYTAIRCPALAIFGESFASLRHGDSSRRARLNEWDTRYFAPFRAQAIRRVRKELNGVEILDVPGDHQEFIYTAKDRLVKEMRRFLGAGGRPPSDRDEATRG